METVFIRDVCYVQPLDMFRIYNEALPKNAMNYVVLEDEI